MEITWKPFEEEKPHFGQMVVTVSGESSFDGQRDYDIAIYKQYEFFYRSEWAKQEELCRVNPHFEGVGGNWIDDPEYWMPLPPIE